MLPQNPLRFSVAPSTMTALSDMDDDRAYFIFSGDLNQMGIIENFLRSRGFPVVKSNVYPGFAKTEEEQYKKALEAVYKARVAGWWNQRTDLLKYAICTEAEYVAALKST